MSAPTYYVKNVRISRIDDYAAFFWNGTPPETSTEIEFVFPDGSEYRLETTDPVRLSQFPLKGTSLYVGDELVVENPCGHVDVGSPFKGVSEYLISSGRDTPDFSRGEVRPLLLTA